MRSSVGTASYTFKVTTPKTSIPKGSPFCKFNHIRSDVEKFVPKHPWSFVNGNKLIFSWSHSLEHHSQLKLRSGDFFIHDETMELTIPSEIKISMFSNFWSLWILTLLFVQNVCQGKSRWQTKLNQEKFELFVQNNKDDSDKRMQKLETILNTFRQP